MKKRSYLTFKTCAALWVLLFPLYTAVSQTPLPDVSDVTGAQIDESGISNIIYVSKTGDDANEGKSLDNSVATITRAMKIALADLTDGIPTKVRIAEGQYRESVGMVDFSEGDALNTLLVIEGERAEGVEILGSDVWNTGWQAHADSLYRHEWPYDWGNTYNPYRGNAFDPNKGTLIAHRSEMIFVNGTLMHQKILEDWSRQEESPFQYDTYVGYTPPGQVLSEGTFGVGERDDHADANTVFLQLPNGVDIASANIEVSVRDVFMEVGQKNNFVLRNLTVKHFRNQLFDNWSETSPIQFSSQEESNSVLIDHCRFVWNNQIGLRLNRLRNATVRNSSFSYNGGRGASVKRNYNVILENNQTNFNCWRNYWGNNTDFWLAGVKHNETQKYIMRNHQAIGNLANGVWWDIHVKNVLAENVVSLMNLERGVFFEISEGPFLLKKSLLAYNNGRDYANFTARYTTLQEVIAYGRTRGSRAANTHYYQERVGNGHWEREPFPAGNTTVSNSIFLGSPDQALLTELREDREAYLGETFTKEDYNGFDNYFYHLSKDSSQDNFLYNNQQTRASYADYLGYMNGQEVNSQWADPMFEDPENFDFRFKEESPLRSNACNYLAIAVDSEVLQEAREFFAWVGADYVTVPQGTADGANQCGSSPTNQIVSVEAPTSVQAGRTAEITVVYSAAQSSEVTIVFQDKSSNHQGYGYKSVAVDAGQDSVTVPLTVNADAPTGTDYQWQTILKPVGGNWNNRYDNLSVGNISVASADTTGVIAAPTGKMLYPNPASVGQTVTFHTEVGRYEIAALYSTDGKLILRKELDEGSKHTFTLGSPLRPGLYTLKLSGSQGTMAQKIVVN